MSLGNINANRESANKYKDNLEMDLESEKKDLSSEIKDDLNNLGLDINSSASEKEKEFMSDLKKFSEIIEIPNAVIKEYFDFVKNDIHRAEDFYECSNNLKKYLGISEKVYEVSGINFITGIFPFYIKKLCPNKFKDILPLIYGGGFYISIMHSSSEIIYITKRVISFIKQFGEDFTYQCLLFCSPFKGSYSENSSSIIDNLNSVDPKIEESFGAYIKFMQFDDNFLEYPKESINLFSFLKEEPQVLSNLGGKEVKSINLSINSGINFAFRGIIEMVKSRSDLNFPTFNEKMSNSEKESRKQQRKKIIKEYETMLRNYISKDKLENNNQKKNTFDKVFFTTIHGDEVWDYFPAPKAGIQKFTGSEIIDYSTGRKSVKSTSRKPIKIIGNKTLGNQAGQESLNPGILSSGKIQLEGTGIENIYSKLKASEQLRFRNGQREIRSEGYIYKIESGNLIRESYILKNSQREVFSIENGTMISDIENYVKKHPQEKVLVFVSHHGGEDGSSGNGWSREDWIRLANISPNIKIWSSRCYFGTAFRNENIYKYKSPVSGFSNNGMTLAAVDVILDLAVKKGLGFNEVEIYTRLNYPAFSPLTEDMKYINQKTGKSEIGKVGLAQNDTGESDDSNKFA